jgi:hypothetical protein
MAPAIHDREAVRNLAVATAELNGDRTISILLGRDVVQRVSAVRILLIIAFGVVEADRPEAIDRYAMDRRFLRIVAVGTHAKGAAGNPGHVAISAIFRLKVLLGLGLSNVMLPTLPRRLYR